LFLALAFGQRRSARNASQAPPETPERFAFFPPVRLSRQHKADISGGNRFARSHRMRHPTDPRDWYGLGRWKLRAKAQLREHPLCARHLEKGQVVPAVIADHVVPHRGDWNEFWLGRLQSLCKCCHESGKKYEEGRGFRSDIGEDGWPLDPRHPTYKRSLG
jgi:hypothetical protein